MGACPVCDQPATRERCRCGYDPSTGDVAEVLELATMQAAESDARVKTMTWVLLAAFPTVALLGLLWPFAQILLASEALFGIPAITFSAFAHRRAQKRLQRAEMLRLPAARAL